MNIVNVEHDNCVQVKAKFLKCATRRYIQIHKKVIDKVEGDTDVIVNYYKLMSKFIDIIYI